MFLARKHLILKSLCFCPYSLAWNSLTRYQLILNKLGKTRKTILYKLTKKGRANFTAAVDSKYSTSEQILRIQNRSLKRHLKYGSYKGIRLSLGLLCMVKERILIMQQQEK